MTLCKNPESINIVHLSSTTVEHISYFIEDVCFLSVFLTQLSTSHVDMRLMLIFSSRTQYSTVVLQSECYCEVYIKPSKCLEDISENELSESNVQLYAVPFPFIFCLTRGGPENISVLCRQE